MLEAGWAKQEKGELKGENIGRRSIFFCMKTFTLRRNKKNRKHVTDQGDWILFVYSKEGWNSSLNRPSQHCSLMERTSVWGAVLHFLPYTLSPFTSCIHPWAQDVHETEVTTSRCQACAQSQQLLSSRHCQEAFLLAFFKATPDWHRSFTALCFLPHIFLQLSQSCHFWLQDLCFSGRGVDWLLLALWEYKIVTCLLLLWTGAIQKRQLPEKWCPSDRLLFKA